MNNSKYYKTFENFTQLRLDFRQQIPGDPAGGIHYRFFQVLTHAILFQFDANFIKFHGVFDFLGHSKIGTMDHVEIEGFSTYRARYTWKMPPNPRTYTTVLKTVAYEAAHKVFSII